MKRIKRTKEQLAMQKGEFGFKVDELSNTRSYTCEGTLSLEDRIRRDFTVGAFAYRLDDREDVTDSVRTT